MREDQVFLFLFMISLIKFIDSGHYFILIFDKNEHKWRKFNDSSSTIISKDEVFAVSEGKILFQKLNLNSI